MSGAFRTFAKTLLEGGYSPLPIIPWQKRPALKEWSNFCAAPMPLDRVQSYGARWPRASLGIALGFNGVIALDIDSEDPAQLAAICASVPMSPVRKAVKKGSTSFFRAAPGWDTLSRICARRVRCWPVFPLVPVFRSTASAAGCPALFGSFFATMAKSDFSCPCITGYGSSPSQCGPGTASRPGQA